MTTHARRIRWRWMALAIGCLILALVAASFDSGSCGSGSDCASFWQPPVARWIAVGVLLALAAFAAVKGVRGTRVRQR